MLTPWPGSAAPEARRPEGTQRYGLWRAIVRSRNAYLFIAPFYLMFVTFMVFPIGVSFLLSLLRWNGIMAPRFVGASNYLRAVADPGFHQALLNTLIYSVLTVSLAVSLGLGMALFLNSVRFLKRLYRGIFFLPSIVSLVIVSLLWKLMLNSEFGLINEAIQAVGRAIGWLTGSVPDWASRRYRFLDSSVPFVPLLTMIMVSVWAVVGFNTVIYLAGLQGIPADLYDVARLDGATAFQRFWNITLPMLRPTTFFVVLITTIDALQVFVQPQIMNRDSESTMTVVYYLYRNAFEFYNMGYASAIAYILFAQTVTLGLVIRRFIGRQASWAGVD
jgi:ABC-type sugar transport system permease subunit